MGPLHIVGTMRETVSRVFASRMLLLPAACLWAATVVMASPISGLTCNWTTSPAYPCIVESPIATDDSEVAAAMLEIDNPYFWDYIESSGFGHCSWAGGLVYRCLETRYTAASAASTDAAESPPRAVGAYLMTTMARPFWLLRSRPRVV